MPLPALTESKASSDRRSLWDASSVPSHTGKSPRAAGQEAAPAMVGSEAFRKRGASGLAVMGAVLPSKERSLQLRIRYERPDRKTGILPRANAAA